MDGRYRGYSGILMTASILAGFAPFPLLAVTQSTAVLAVILAAFLLCSGGIILACYAPCRWAAGKKGFMISVLGFKRFIDYDSVTDIECKYVNTRYGGMMKLMITDDIGTRTFYEMCSADNMTALINDPKSEKKPQLMQLCEFVQRTKGEVGNDR